MSINVTVNGTSYTIPQISETGWGTNVTNWVQAISGATLQKNGGTFTLTADVDFGASFGVKTLYIKSETANIAATGIVRLANTDKIAFRNAGNSADLALGVDSSNRLTFNGNIIDNSTSLSASVAMVTDASGAPTTSATTATQVGYLSTATSDLQVQITGKQATLPLSTKGDLLGFSTVVARQAVGSDGTVLSADSTQTNGLRWVSPLTNPMSNVGDIIVGGTAGAATKLASGTAGQVLTSSGLTSALSWTTTNPMTTGGDIIYGGASGVQTRLANGSVGQYLVSGGGTAAPVWTAINSSVYVDSGNGHGSTNTKVRRYTNARLNTGSDITYADSATLGASFTINTAGVYAMKMEDQIAGNAALCGITVNATLLTTNVDTLTYAQGRRAISFPGTNNSIVSATCFLILAVNDVVRPGDDGTNTDTGNASNFLITRVA